MSSNNDMLVFFTYLEVRREAYLVRWVKTNAIGTYVVEKQADHDNPVFHTLPRGMGKYRIHFDSFFTTNSYDAHTLVIKHFNHQDVSHYTLFIYRIEYGWSESTRSVELRHIGKFKLEMPQKLSNTSTTPR